ncbi:MAG: helix-turn-helix transcriptional regulator, partial [Halobacteriales archaeon]
ELLSDEERVLRLLRERGGRMKQVDIVEETDWSNAKVSQLLSSMAEAGDVEKLRIGRENLISLPDEEE